MLEALLVAGRPGIGSGIGLESAGTLMALAAIPTVAAWVLASAAVIEFIVAICIWLIWFGARVVE